MASYPRSTRVASLGLVVALAATAGFVVGRRAAPSTTEGASPVAGTASPSEVHLTVVSGIRQADPGIMLEDLAPGDLPYAYVGSPPPEVGTPVDGAYIRILPLEGLGPPSVALPMRCLRCIPFRVEAGTSTLILYRGRYFLNHQLSGFRTVGFYRVRGPRITFYDDPNCGTSRGVYRWTRTGTALELRVVRDPCPFDELRSQDLTHAPWASFSHCVLRIVGLWPGELGCRNRAFQP